MLIGMLFLGCIAPHVFQFIEPPAFRQHNMYDDVYIIDQYPLEGLSSLVRIREFTAVALCGFFYMIGYRFHLRTAPGFTNDKEVRYCFGYLPQIKGNNFFSFFLLNGLYYGFKDFRIPR